MTIEDIRNLPDLDTAAFDVESIISSTSEDFQHRLHSVEAQLLHLPIEVAFGYSAAGKELFRVKGNALAVQLTPEQKQLVRGGILTHNHPDGSFFSVGDVGEAHDMDLTELRAVSNRTPAVVFSMRRPARGWRKPLFAYYISREEQRCINEVKQPDQTDAETVRLANALFKEQYADILRKFGLTYEVLPLQ
ncbi:hypothetical protein [Hymenobacter sp. DG01]|uniref:hypothetical protein n=1 Tax=Hymenobacter sp. DG01 TaxID=2584940 RepID=UPI0011234E2E|nr:hypothetical protein [Hymenobacter sp. DG01]